MAQSYPNILALKLSKIKVGHGLFFPDILVLKLLKVEVGHGLFFPILVLKLSRVSPHQCLHYFVTIDEIWLRFYSNFRVNASKAKLLAYGFTMRTFDKVLQCGQ